MNQFTESLKNNIILFNEPFKHWEIKFPLSQELIEEISSVKIPEGQRSYDGTRAADNTGRGIDGKLRVFIDKSNSILYPNLKNLIRTLCSKNCQNIISDYINRDLLNSYVRLEVISDKVGFWLNPHKDIEEKIMTMMIWINNFNESENLGTDFYDKNFKLFKTAKYIHNTGYFFSSGKDTWHGLEKKQINNERRCIQINYVSFKTDWPVD